MSRLKLACEAFLRYAPWAVASYAASWVLALLVPAEQFGTMTADQQFPILLVQGALLLTFVVSSCWALVIPACVLAGDPVVAADEEEKCRE